MYFGYYLRCRKRQLRLEKVNREQDRLNKLRSGVKTEFKSFREALEHNLQMVKENSVLNDQGGYTFNHDYEISSPNKGSPSPTKSVRNHSVLVHHKISEQLYFNVDQHNLFSEEYKSQNNFSDRVANLKRKSHIQAHSPKVRFLKTQDQKRNQCDTLVMIPLKLIEEKDNTKSSMASPMGFKSHESTFKGIVKSHEKAINKDQKVKFNLNFRNSKIHEPFKARRSLRTDDSYVNNITRLQRSTFDTSKFKNNEYTFPHDAKSLTLHQAETHQNPSTSHGFDSKRVSKGRVSFQSKNTSRSKKLHSIKSSRTHGNFQTLAEKYKSGRLLSKRQYTCFNRISSELKNVHHSLHEFQDEVETCVKSSVKGR